MDMEAIKDSVQTNKNTKAKEECLPNDSYYLVMIVFFMFGLGEMVPINFFLTAYDFWMHKFRDITSDNFDLRNRTFLQTNFISLARMVSSIPILLTAFLSSYAAHKIHIRTRLMTTLTATTTTFLIFILFVVINTDSWQTGFFVLTIAFFGATNILGTLFGMSCMAVLSKFPPNYIKVYMYGMTMSGVVSALIQIACLAIGGSSEEVGLMFFSTGGLILFFTVIFAYLTKYSPFYNHYIGDTDADTKRPLPDFTDMWNVSKMIWPFLVLLFLAIPTMHMGFPVITTQVVSEGYGDGHPWNDKYFVPVITYLLYDIIGLFGRFFATPFITPEIAVCFTILQSVVMTVLPTLFLFCNALPRQNLPVLFPHDWQYIVILCLNSFESMYIASSSLLSVKNFAKEKTELAFMILQALGRGVFLASSPLGAVYVNIL